MSTQFIVHFVARPNVDAVKALRAVLKRALRDHGLRAVEAYPLVEAMAPDLPAQLASLNAPTNVGDALVQLHRDVTNRLRSSHG
jgi:hypothetical protein